MLIDIFSVTECKKLIKNIIKLVIHAYISLKISIQTDNFKFQVREIFQICHKKRLVSTFNLITSNNLDLCLQFPQAFHQHQQFKLLLKERVCSLVIKLFSPNLKYKMSGSQQLNQDMKPSYAITSKLLRVVAVLTLQYHGKNIFLLKILYTILQKID